MAASAGVERASAAPARLRGRWLIAARLTWLIVAAISLIQVIFGAPAEFALYARPCAIECGGSALTPASVLELQALGMSLTGWALFAVSLELLFVGAWSTVALMIFWRKSDEPLAWFVSLTLLTFGHAFPGFTQVLWSFDRNPFWMLLAAPVLLFAVIGIVIFFYIFPDGRFVPRWTRPLSLLWAAWSVIWFAATWLNPPEIYFNTYYLALALGVACQIYRYRRVADPIQKQQTKWVVFGVSVAMAVFLGLNLVWMLGVPLWGSSLAATFLTQTTIYVCMSLIPLSIDMAIFRSRLWDIDVIISRTLVYGALTASVIAIYVLVVGYLATLFQASGNLAISLAATGLIAVLFQPLRDRLQRAVNRLVYAERDDPYAVISRLNQRLEATLAPDAVLPTIVETVREALKLPYVAVALDHSSEFNVLRSELTATSTQNATFKTQNDEIVASYGEPQAELLTLPLTYRGEAVGQLLLAPRAAGEAFTSADRRLLDDLARQAGVAAHAVRLTGDLQRSRERLVTAREEERRRLRRDLHDGLGPQLATLTLKLDAARNLIERAPETASGLLTELKTQTQAAIADIRRLVYELRPPALDELGLVGALCEQARQYTLGELSVTVAAPDGLPALPAAVEVAAYRIALEALTNVVRHAGARNCQVLLRLGAGSLELLVEDDGCGIAPERLPGVGLHSMRERAAELGGSCEIASARGDGTRVRALLPLPHAAQGAGA